MILLTYHWFRGLSLIPTPLDKVPSGSAPHWEQLTPPMRNSSSPITLVTLEEESSWVWPTPTSPPWYPLSPTVELPLASPHLWVQRRQPSVQMHPYHCPTPLSP